MARGGQARGRLMWRLAIALLAVPIMSGQATADDDLPPSASIIECAVFWHVVADGAARQGLLLGERPAATSKMMIDAGFAFAKARGEAAEALNANIHLMLQRMSGAAFDQDKLILLTLQYKPQCDRIEDSLLQLLREYQSK